MRQQLRFRAALLVALFATPATAETSARQYDLVCHAVGKRGVINRKAVEQQFSLDLDAARFCRLDINDDCKVMPLVERGRWIDLSYRYTDTLGRSWETARLFDSETGWLDQVLRRVGEPGAPYGDLVCDRAPFSDFRPATPAKPAGTAGLP